MAKSLTPRDGGGGRSSSSSSSSTLSTAAIIVLNSVFLLTLQQFFQNPVSLLPASYDDDDVDVVAKSRDIHDDDDDESLSLSSSSPFGMIVPRGRATALPSIPVSAEEDATIKRNIYGGKGDKAHLGGFTSFDPHGVSPTLWAHMVTHLGIKSLLDLGCGRGISTSWFVTHGLPYVVCAEGSHDAVTRSLLPGIISNNVPKNNGTHHYETVEHDFSRGPWWPERTVDVAWCVEFTEHVGRNYIQNYHTAFRKAALIFATHSNWGGWHHVEVHDDDWWRVKMEASGFVYSDALTSEMRSKAHVDARRTDLLIDMKTKNKTTYNVGQHLWGTLQVFINPLVASLPEHAHLFAEHGCYTRGGKGKECGKEGEGAGSAELTPLPESFKPLQLSSEMDDQWMELIKDLKLA